MVRTHHVRKGSKLVFILFIASLVILPTIGAYFGTRGNKVNLSRYPAIPYEEVTFKSAASDKLPLTGWYFPANSETVALLVHGWGGNRARLLNLAEYLNSNGINVLTFDVRGGTGKNSYGQKESEDIAGAVAWLENAKKISPASITIVGASMGGAATVSYSLDHPVKKMVLVSPVLDIRQVKYQVLKDRHIILPQLYASIATVIERIFYGVKPINPVNRFQDIVVPVFVLHGEKDELSPTQTAKTLQEKMIAAKKTNIEFLFVPNGAHTFLDLDKANNYLYSQKILEFIQK